MTASFQQSRAQPAPPGERYRRQIVRLIFIIYWLLIFEGVLRKWILPQIHQILFFIRDPFVLSVYYLAWKHRMWPRPTPLFVFSLVLTGVGVFLVLFQMVAGTISPLVGAYGWRNYFMYIPLAFIIGEQLNDKDLLRIIRQTLIVSIPIAVLVFLQFKSSPGAWVNRTYGEESTVFMVTGDIVRTTGTFTFSAGHALFVGSIVVMLLCVWLTERARRPMSNRLLWLSSAAVLTNVAVCGSRLGLVIAAIAFLVGTLAVFIAPRARINLRVLILPPLIALVGYGLVLAIFPTAYEAMRERQEKAELAGSFNERLINIGTDVFSALPSTSLLGVGLGAGTTGIFIAFGGERYRLSENELPRILQEAGIFGILYIALRWWLLVWLFTRALKATVRTQSAIPLLIWAFAGPMLAVHQITLQGTANGYGWIFAGLSMAANRLGSGSHGPARVSPPWRRLANRSANDGVALS